MNLMLVVSFLLRFFAVLWLGVRFWRAPKWTLGIVVATFGALMLREFLVLCDVGLLTDWNLTIGCGSCDLTELLASVGMFFLALMTGPTLSTEATKAANTAEVKKQALLKSETGGLALSYWKWFSVLAGTAAMFLSVLVGYSAYCSSKQTLLSTAVLRYRTTAQSLVRLLERSTVKAQNKPQAQGQSLRMLQEYWKRLSLALPDAYLLVVQSPGTVVFDSRGDLWKGKDVSGLVLEERGGRRLTIADLLRRKAGWSGEHVSSTGEPKLLACVFAEPLNGLIMIGQPAYTLEKRIERMARPWAFGLLLVVGVLLPLSFGLLHYGYYCAESGMHRAMQALADSEERHRVLLELLPNGVERCDLSGRITFANRAHALMHGYAPGETVGMYIWDFCISEEAKRERKALFQRLVEEQPEPCPVLAQDLTKNGRIIHVQTDWAYERDQAGRLTGFVAIVTDITERVWAEQSLRESEERFRTLCESAPVGIFLADSQGSWLYVNPLCVELTGLPGEQCLGDGWAEAVPASEREQLLKGWKEACRLAKPFTSEVRFVLPDGKTHWVQFHAVPRIDEQSGRLVGYVGTLMDITQRLEAERAQQQLADRLHGLSRQLLEAQEIERRRIASNLHDEIGQLLTALKVSLQSLRRLTTPSDDSQADLLHQEWGSCLNMLDQTIQRVREISRNLRPSVLDDLGLNAAIQWLLKQQVAGGLNAYLETNLDEIRLPAHIETAVFRIVQEAVHNCVKHAEASRVEVCIRVEGNELYVAIEDDGRGFEVSKAMETAGQGKSMGLLGMHERVACWAERFWWIRNPDAALGWSFVFRCRPLFRPS